MVAVRFCCVCECDLLLLRFFDTSALLALHVVWILVDCGTVWWVCYCVWLPGLVYC